MGLCALFTYALSNQIDREINEVLSQWFLQEFLVLFFILCRRSNIKMANLFLPESKPVGAGISFYYFAVNQSVSIMDSIVILDRCFLFVFFQRLISVNAGWRQTWYQCAG
jgi:hypothetical protein